MRMLLRLIPNKLSKLCGSIRFKYSRATINEVHSKYKVGDAIQVKGWVYNFRKTGKYYFFDMRDGSTHERLQVLVPVKVQKENPGLGFGASVSVSGVIGTAPRGHIDLCAEDFQLIGACPVDDGHYPFVRKVQYSYDVIRKYLHLRGHCQEFQSIFRTRHFASLEIHNYFNENGFFLVHTPIVSSNSCEGAGELFSILPANTELLAEMNNRTDRKPNDEVYFNKKAFLSLSGQMHLEAMCQRLGSVYSFGPVFRAESTTSPVHMSEFYMVEAEQSFVDSVHDITKRIECLLKTVTNNLLEKYSKDIDAAYTISIPKEEQIGNDERFKWLHKPFSTITYAEAREILENNGQEQKSLGRISKANELFLVQHLDTPVFVIDWPKESKPFYMRQCRDNPNSVEGVDLLMPIVGELAGGSIREDNIAILEKSLPDDVKWYLDLRTYGGCTTGGFGIGFDRYLQILLGLKNIKDTIPFPRYARHCNV